MSIKLENFSEIRLVTIFLVNCVDPLNLKIRLETFEKMVLNTSVALVFVEVTAFSKEIVFVCSSSIFFSISLNVKIL